MTPRSNDNHSNENNELNVVFIIYTSIVYSYVICSVKQERVSYEYALTRSKQTGSKLLIILKVNSNHNSLIFRIGNFIVISTYIQSS